MVVCSCVFFASFPGENGGVKSGKGESVSYFCGAV